MKLYTDTDLEALLSDIESDQVERKESWKGDAPNKAREAVCAFANDLPDHRCAGVLFVGARPDGSPSHLPITDALLCTLADIKTDGNILPPPSIVVEKKILRNAEMAVVTVYPSDNTPVRYKGRIWVRTGPRRSLATSQDERILNERRRSRDLPFDLQPLPSCTLSALSRVLFEQEYLPRAVAPDILAENNRSYEERLASCRMIDPSTSTPTVFGMLVLGISPRDWIPCAYIQFLRISGVLLSDPIVDEATLEGTLTQVLRRMDEKIEAHNRVEVDMTSANVETRRGPYPRVALQQLIRNAVMHRSYENTHAPVRVHWFSDRIEIVNPGGPYGIVTRDNFSQPGITDYRNPNVAEAMKVMGFVQRFGVGIQIARAELHNNNNPDLEFQIEPTTVLATVKRRP